MRHGEWSETPPAYTGQVPSEAETPALHDILPTRACCTGAATSATSAFSCFRESSGSNPMPEPRTGLSKRLLRKAWAHAGKRQPLEWTHSFEPRRILSHHGRDTPRHTRASDCKPGGTSRFARSDRMANLRRGSLNLRNETSDASNAKSVSSVPQAWLSKEPFGACI